MRASGIRRAQAGAEVVRVLNAVEDEQQRRLGKVGQQVEQVGKLLLADVGINAQHDALMARVAGELVKTGGVGGKNADAVLTGKGERVAGAGVLALFGKVHFAHGLRIAAQFAERGVKTIEQAGVAGGVGHAGRRFGQGCGRRR